MIQIQTFETDSSNDDEIATRVNNVVGNNRVISVEQVDGYKWRVVYEITG